jgi:hypothetical protein
VQSAGLCPLGLGAVPAVMSPCRWRITRAEIHSHHFPREIVETEFRKGRRRFSVQGPGSGRADASPRPARSKIADAGEFAIDHWKRRRGTQITDGTNECPLFGEGGCEVNLCLRDNDKRRLPGRKMPNGSVNVLLIEVSGQCGEAHKK